MSMMTTAQPNEYAAIFQKPEWFEEFKRMPMSDFPGLVEVWGKRPAEEGLGMVEILADSNMWTLAEFKAWLTEGGYAPQEIIEATEVMKALAVGDWAQYAVPKPPGPTQYATGQVVDVSTDGLLTSGQEQVEGTTDDPAIKLRVWARSEDDSFTLTDRHVVKPESKLREVDEPAITKQEININDQVMVALRRKVDEHNDKHGDDPAKRATLGMLVESMKRGIGAYKSNPGSVRPNVTSAEQWGYGRVNGLLHALATGRYKRTPFDRDLLPEGHPMATTEKDDDEREGLFLVQYDADLYDTPGQALERASEIGCVGYHVHEVSGETKYMPCDLMADYEQAIGLRHRGDDDLTLVVTEKAEWSTAFVNTLPDSAFFFIGPGGEKDDTGRTVPRSLRKLPYRGQGGEVDLPHLRNVLARLSQADIPANDRERIRREARRLLEESTAKAVSKATYDDLDFTPPKGVQEAAELGLSLRREHGRGGTLVGVARARDLSGGKAVSPDTLRRMASFFARHEVDLDAPSNSDRSDPGYPGAGRIAWLLWGGDAGRRWADKLVEQMRRRDEVEAAAKGVEFEAVKAMMPPTDTDTSLDSIRQQGASVVNWVPDGDRAILVKGGGINVVKSLGSNSQDLGGFSQLSSALKPGTAVEVVVTPTGEAYATDLLMVAGVDVTKLTAGVRKSLLPLVVDEAVLEVAVGHLVESGAEAVLTGREMVDTMSGGIMESRPVEGVYGQLTTLALTEHRPALWKMVPPRLSDNPQALVVTGNPNRVEAIRGLPLVGPDGATFRKSYLERLGVGVGDVSIAHACPAVGETTEAWAEWLDRLVDRHAGVPVIALGKQASVALGDRDHTTLPHPRAVRLRGDRGEVSRKAKAIQKTMAAINHLRSQTWHCPILKSDDDRRMVYGVVLEPGTVDLQGDVLALDTIESAAHKYLIQHRTVGDSHSQLAGAEVVESYLAPADLELGGQIISQGSWVMGVHVTDDHLWLAVKAGEYTGFSIGGTGERKEITVD